MEHNGLNLLVDFYLIIFLYDGIMVRRYLGESQVQKKNKLNFCASVHTNYGLKVQYQFVVVRGEGGVRIKLLFVFIYYVYC